MVWFREKSWFDLKGLLYNNRYVLKLREQMWSCGKKKTVTVGLKW